MERIRVLQGRLSQAGICAAVFRLPENLVMFTGYYPVNGVSTLLVPASGEPILLIPHLDESYVPRLPFRVQLFGWSRLGDPSPNEAAREMLSDWAGGFGSAQLELPVAVERDVEQVAPAVCAGETLLPGREFFGVLRQVLKTDQLVEVEGLIADLRTIKNANDLAGLKRVNQIAKPGLVSFEEMLRQPGCTEIELAAAVESAIAIRGAREGIPARAWAQVTSGVNTCDAYYPGRVPTARVLAEGDLAVLELATVANGYWSDLTLTAVCGEAPEDIRRMVAVVRDANEAAMQTVRAGQLASTVDEAARHVITQAGYADYFIHHTGHGLGFRYHEPVPLLAPGSADVLQEGMVHSVEPGIYIPGVGGVRIETNVYVTADGCVQL